MRHPGSFRDPDSGLVWEDGRLLRYVRGRSADGLVRAEGCGLARRLVDRGSLVAYAESGPPASSDVHNARWIEVTKVPFVSYPYEWPFRLLKDAALLQLDLQLEAMDEGLTFKDATPFNVQFRGTTPVFADHGSICPAEPGTPWEAYAQFCRTFLYPLLIASATAVDVRAMLRAVPDGIPSEQASALLPLHLKARPAVFAHVVLQARLRNVPVSRAPELRGVQVAPRRLRGQVEGLRSLVASLDPHSRPSSWLAYEQERTYTAQAIGVKTAVIEETARAAQPRSVWDLGANLGEAAFRIAPHAGVVVAIEADPAAADELADRAQAHTNVLPLCIDLRNPSPDQGWAQREHRGLQARGPADLTLVLAIVHHLRIAGGIPIPLILDWLLGSSRQAVIELVPRSDPQVRRMLAWRDDIFDDLEPGPFEAALRERADIERVVRLPESARMLYVVRSRSAAANVTMAQDAIRAEV